MHVPHSLESRCVSFYRFCSSDGRRWPQPCLSLGGRLLSTFSGLSTFYFGGKVSGQLKAACCFGFAEFTSTHNNNFVLVVEKNELIKIGHFLRPLGF